MEEDVIQNFINKNSDKAMKYRLKIEDMLDSGNYDYAEDTLAGILDFICNYDKVTEAQIKAVENIYEKPAYELF
jgi:methylaspartate ammonia-lyase